MNNYLPIGTVVLLNNGKKPISIMGYKVASESHKIYKGDEEIDSNEVYDYCGVIYPEGVIDSNAMCMFNHSDIQKVLYMGYVSDDYKNLIDFIHENEKNS